MRLETDKETDGDEAEDNSNDGQVCYVQNNEFYGFGEEFQREPKADDDEVREFREESVILVVFRHFEG